MGCKNCTPESFEEEINDISVIQEIAIGEIKIKVLLGRYTSALTQAIVHPTNENFDDKSEISKQLNKKGGKPYRKILERSLNNYGPLTEFSCRSTGAGRRLETFKYIIHVNGPDSKYLQND